MEFTKKDIASNPPKTTECYLKENNINLTTALRFTINDYRYLTDKKFKLIVINHNKPSKEYLSKSDIVNRISELCVLLRATNNMDVDYVGINNDILIPNSRELKLNLLLQ